jgi:PIN domain nuclease of toxin-antitoxin system
MILLDTCVVLWLEADPSAISEAACQAMTGAPGSLWVSAISAFEIGQKAAAKKLTLRRPVDQWFPAVLDRHGLREITISGAIAARATRLPPIHRDPFDRLLIATAQQQHLTLLTPDPTIAKYPALRTLW